MEVGHSLEVVSRDRAALLGGGGEAHNRLRPQVARAARAKAHHCGAGRRGPSPGSALIRFDLETAVLPC